MRNRVLITGIEGFTGKHLSELLSFQGFEVFGSSYLPSKIDGVVQLDLKQKDAMADILASIKPNYVIHLAGLSHVIGDTVEFYNTNVIGTQNLLDCLVHLNLNLEKVILASSALVYGDKGGVLNENDILNPVNHYGISKLAMEKVANTYFNQLPLIIARPFNYTGEGQSPNFVIPKIIRHFKEGAEVLELGNIHAKREFNSVSDVVSVYSFLMRYKKDSFAINIGSGQAYTIEEILQLLKSLTGHEIEVVINPLFVRPNEVLKLKSDPTLLTSIMGSNMFKTPLKETLHRMLLA